MGAMRNACRVFMGTSEGNRPLGRKDDIKLDLREVG
jgi:hypothetical protein